ncbi:hypothetical protein TcCL_NonESM08728 [Trypanosoma cruzi]|nr:hypothetical protein TcCL_NonESM08728 [Trypanosoma cruzi]
MDGDEKRPTATASSSIPRTTRHGHSPQPTHYAHGASNHPMGHAQKRFLIRPMKRCLTPCGHTECTVSSIDLILLPSLKAASVIDGPSNTIEENKHAVIMPYRQLQ